MARLIIGAVVLAVLVATTFYFLGEHVGRQVPQRRILQLRDEPGTRSFTLFHQCGPEEEMAVKTTRVVPVLASNIELCPAQEMLAEFKWSKRANDEPLTLATFEHRPDCPGIARKLVMEYACERMPPK